jgi:hypothetical protein
MTEATTGAITIGRTDARQARAAGATEKIRDSVEPSTSYERMMSADAPEKHKSSLGAVEEMHISLAPVAFFT